MSKREDEFVVNIPQLGEEPLRGKFRVKLKLSYREILGMDALRRQLLGPGGNEADGMATVIASGIAKIRTHALETPSWWKDAEEGLGFDDINVVLTVLQELNKVEQAALDELKKAAEGATQDLKKSLETK